MYPLPMRYLVFISSCFLLSCSSVYKKLQRTTGDVACVQQFKPAFATAFYTTQVDVVGKHLSGILVFKQMPDSSTRIVFTSETGPTFFDFEFTANGNFTVHYILDQMNKKAVIKTLRKDFELVLLHNTSPANGYLLTDTTQHLHYYAFPQEKGTNYYVTNESCTELFRAEKSSKRKPVVVAQMLNYQNGLPDTIGITHKKFNFTIALKRLERNVAR